MSTDEETQMATLADFQPDTTPDTQEDTGGSETAAWKPQDERKCRNCDQKVTDQYRRVAGDNQDIVHECPRCPDDDTGKARRMNGAAAGLKIEDHAVGGAIK